MRIPKRLVFIGLGGIGSWLIEPVCRYFLRQCKTVLLIDGDIVEHKNLRRQSFPSDSVRTYKAEAARTFLYRRVPGLIVEGHVAWVDEKNVVNYLREDDAVFVNPDNHELRRVVAQAAKSLQNIAVFTAGNQLYDGSCHVYVVWNGIELTKDFLRRHPEAIDKEGDEEPGCSDLIDHGETQLIATNFMMAAMVLMAVHQVYHFGSLRSPQEGWTQLPQEVYGSLIAGRVRTAMAPRGVPEEVEACS